MRTISILALAACIASFAAPAQAQDEVIVVTATRTPTPLQRLAARVEVIDRDDIEAQAIATLTEAVGAQAVQAGGAGQQASFFLRGGNSKHALALLDGVRLNDASTPNAQYDYGLDTLGALELIEVLRGPASAIYGSDAIGGVVNLIPRRGGDTAFDPFIEIAGGSFETRRATLGAAGTRGALDYGVTAEVLDSAGYDVVPARFAMHTGDPDAARLATFTASARARFGDLGVDALARFRDFETEFDTFSAGAFFDLRGDDPDLRNETTQSVWRLGGDVDLGLARVRASGGQVRNDRSELDGTFVTNAAESVQTFVDANARVGFGAFSILAGAAYARDEIDTLPQFASPLSADEDQSALYLIVQSPIRDSFDATASVRMDDNETFGAHTTYSFGLVGRFDPVRVFGSYGTAFKAPSLSERFETSAFNIGNPDLDPETSRSWEIGADWTVLADGRLTLGGSYYETRVEDLIEYDFGLLQNINIGRADIDGAEAYVETAPVSWGSLRLAYAWTDPRNGITGAQLIRRPEHALRFDARVRPITPLELALTWSFVGERGDVTYDNAGVFLSGNGRVSSFHAGALAATYALNERAALFARVDNLTDETYEQPSAFAGAPRAFTFGIRASY